MQQLINLILESGSSGIELALYVIVPIMVVMMALMKLLEDTGVLNRIANLIAPLLGVFGLPGLGAFAILQCLLISFAAPVVTLKLMDKNSFISGPNIAATMAAILTISQANATFPLAVEGLNLPVVFASSIVGALLSALVAHKVSSRIANKNDLQIEKNKNSIHENKSSVDDSDENRREYEIGKKLNVFKSLLNGAEEGFWTGIKAAPVLILSLFFVNILRETSVIELMETALTPILVQINIPGIAVLPIVTKYLAGATAMMGVTMDLMAEGGLSALQLNRIAGIGINPIDPVAVSLYVAAGFRMKKQIKPAFIGAGVGVILKTVFHLVLF